MAMKAERGKLVEGKVDRDVVPGDGWKDRKEVDFPEKKNELRAAEEVGHPDEVIAVMMPRETYDAFMALAVKHGGSTAEAMGTALKLLESALNKEEG